MSHLLHGRLPSNGGGDEAAESSPRRFVEQLARKKIQGFRANIGEDGNYLDRIYESSAEQAANIAMDYRDRFMIELIQNAYDAHPSDTRAGRIEITLDLRETLNGTLYVSNDGRPFTQANVESLSYIGLSAKPAGESIGNKGLGFRSVVQITDSPLIYSQDASEPTETTFSGFCFRFASDADIKLAIDDPRHYALACRDLPKFHIPVWLQNQAPSVRAYATQKFSTLVAMPLRDEVAQQAVRRQIEALRSQKVPLLLFLDRVEVLRVRVLDREGQIETEFSFGRKEEEQKFDDFVLSRVTLGEAGTFVVARRAVPEEAMKTAIAEAIAGKELNEGWAKWKGPGDVAVAVRLDGSVETPRLYTYLPMGEQAEAPFQGYLQGSFFPSANRKHLDAKHRLNALLLEEATALVAEAIHVFVVEPSAGWLGSLPEHDLAKVVAEMMSWKTVGSLQADVDVAKAVAKSIAERFTCDSIDDAAVVPCIGSCTGCSLLVWKTPSRARLWSTTEGPFAEREAARHAHATGVWPIWADPGSGGDALDHYLMKHASRYLGAPTGEERAQLVVQVARSLPTNPRKAKVPWQEYFESLPEFMEDDGACLAGMPVLLGDDGAVHKAMAPVAEASAAGKGSRRRRAKETAIFSPPDQRRAGEIGDPEVDPPKKLGERFGFLWEALPWHRDLAGTRVYLEKYKLVEEFNSEAIFTHLDRTLRDEKNKDVLKGGLRWAFQLWRQAQVSNRPFRLPAQHRFRVPTLNGDYIDAKDAVFSAAWPEATLGSLVQEFIDEAPSGLADIEGLKDCRLASPEHQAFRNKMIDDWVTFLSELGVGQGLRPLRKTTRAKSFKAHQIRDFSFIAAYNLPVGFGDLWRNDIENQDSSLLDLPSSTDYVVEGELSWLPAQADLETFSPICAGLYACLIVHWLASELDVPTQVLVHHRVSHWADRRHWPTPLAAFLRSAKWMPVEGSSRTQPDVVMVSPSDVWLNVVDGDHFLPFLPRPVRALRKLIETKGSVLVGNLKKHAKLHQIGDPKTLHDQLAFLAHNFARAEFDDYFRPRLLNLYASTWREFLSEVTRTGQDLSETVRPVHILAQRRRSIEIIDMDDEDAEPSGPVYICDAGRAGDADLLAASGQAFFQLTDSDPERTGICLEAFYGARARRMSRVDYALSADGKSIDNIERTAVLLVLPELRAMLAVAVEALTGTEARRLPSNRAEVLDKLDRISLASASSLQFQIDGIDIGTEQLGRQAFNLTSGPGDSVIVIKSDEEWGWDLVDSCLSPICEVLGHRTLAPHLRLLLVHLRQRRQFADRQGPRDTRIGDMADILMLPQSAVEAAIATLSAGPERRIPLIRAVLHLAAGSGAVEEFDKKAEDAVRDVALLRPLLSQLLKESLVDVDALVAVSRSAFGPRDFRESLGLDFAGFNSSLIAVGEGPETYPEQHRWSLETFIRQHELAITQCLLEKFGVTLAAMKPAEGYGEARTSIREIAPDPDWLLVFEQPPDAIMERHVNDWLAEKGASALSEPDGKPSDLIAVRDHNKKAFQDFYTRSVSIVRAWCAKFQPDLDLSLFTGPGAYEVIRRKLDGVGVLDYRELDDGAIASWLRSLDVWPSEMPPTLDFEELRLSESDMKDETQKAREAHEKRKREARSVAFNGRSIDPAGDVDYLALADELKGVLSSDVLRGSLGANTSLEHVKPNDNSSGSGKDGAKSKGKSGLVRAPQEKTELIGRLGEMVVYLWLKHILVSQDIDGAWRSENASVITAREGNDGIGFDFEVSYQKKTWQIEVKASVDDPQAFELGETEVRAARIAAKSRSGIEYKIAYVSHVSDPSRTRVEILPNPMSDEGSQVLALRGEGIRYSFNRTSSIPRAPSERPKLGT